MDPDERVPRIGEVKIKVKPEYYLQRARQEQLNGNDVLAIENYVNYMENLGNHNEMKLEEQINLTKLVLNLGAALEAKDAEDEVMKCYVGILNHFPKNVLILNAFAVYLFSRGEYNVARGYFQRAASEGYLPAEKNLLHVLWNLVPRWHFRMLNDVSRNRAYQKALQKAIRAGYKHVYDIGSGAGLLTLIAATFSKEVFVTAFEENRTLHNVAVKIAKSYNLTNVCILLQNSNDVHHSDTPCDLIVTEIFDAALLGENCLESIGHALDHFVEGKFKVIPAGATMYVTGVESVALAKQARFVGAVPALKLENICVRELLPEPYDAEYLKNENVKYVTETKHFLKINFYDKAQLRNLQSEDCIDEVEVVCKEAGTIDAFAVWFDLNLDDEITISTSPFSSDIECWEQAVFVLKHPFRVDKGDVIKIKPRISQDGQMSFSVLSHEGDCSRCFKASKKVISFLNDAPLVEAICRAVDGYGKYDLKIIDLNAFPLFGYLMAKKGATVYHVYKDMDDIKFFQHVQEANEIAGNKMIFIPEKTVEDYMVYMEAPDVVYTDLIKTDGSWNKVEFTVEVEAKLTSESLPKKIFLKAQLVHSDYLDVCNKVDDCRALSFRIGEYMNDFSGTEHPNLKYFPHEKFSDVVVFDISDLDVIDYHSEAAVTQEGLVNGIYYWFDVQITDDESVRFSTLNSTHYGRVCTLFKSPKQVKKGDKVIIHVWREDGHLKVYCD